MEQEYYYVFICQKYRCETVIFDASPFEEACEKMREACRRTHAKWGLLISREGQVVSSWMPSEGVKLDKNVM